MTIYTHSVYWVHLPEHTDITNQGYIGVSNNPRRRFLEHKNQSPKKKDINPYFNRELKKHSERIILTIIFQGTKDSCYSLEEELRPINNIGWNANRGGIIPPSKLGWKPSQETLIKRSANLKGIERHTVWKENLSNSKKGSKNGMYGKKNPCSDERKLAIIVAKNTPNYHRYKTAIEMMNNGVQVKDVCRELNIGRGVCFNLKNRKHLFFQAFPELK